MPTAIFLLADGRQIDVDVPTGTSLMRAATENGVEGILGDCGGSLSCATCHVLVEPEFLDRLPSPAADEDAMLDFTAADRQPNSRLCCQVVMADGLNGIRVRVPQTQG